MKLSKDTWHYRNYYAWLIYSESVKSRELHAGYRQVSLCIYTRAAMIYGPLWRFTKWIGGSDKRLATAWIVGIYLIVLGFTGLLVHTSEENEWNQWLWLIPLAIEVAFAVVAVVVVSVLAFFAWCTEKLRERRGQQPSGPNIAVEYVKAKKRKICPLIEFEND